MTFDSTKLSVLLYGLEKLLRLTARRHPAFAARLKQKDLVVQIRLRDGTQGRTFVFQGGAVTSRAGLHGEPRVTLSFETAAIATRLLRPRRTQLDLVSAAKTFQVETIGADEEVVWLSETLNMLATVGAEYGIEVGGGVRRFTSNTNGGVVFVHVKDGKILRITPIELEDGDAPTWSVEARGKTFTPPRKSTVNAHTLAWKSLVYSPDRLLYPMKRVDFDPDGERNPQNRGTSG